MPVVSELEVADNMLAAGKLVRELISKADSLKGRAKAPYYKASYIFLASIVESMLYLLIKLHCDLNDALKDKSSDKKLIKKIRLNSAQMGTTKKLWVAEDKKVPFALDKADFYSMINFCRETGILKNRVCESLDIVRKKRNEVHLHTFSHASYTKRMLDTPGRLVSRMQREFTKIIAEIEAS